VGLLEKRLKGENERKTGLGVLDEDGEAKDTLKRGLERKKVMVWSWDWVVFGG
jgi:hypothetical protein